MTKDKKTEIHAAILPLPGAIGFAVSGNGIAIWIAAPPRSSQ
jgi:hypothetical protein